MGIFSTSNPEFECFTNNIKQMIENISGLAKVEDMNSLNKLVHNFKLKTEDFYRENRKLNIAVVGQVKAGKSSFLNTLLFEGKEILPKASTPKTATLTKMEYSEQNIIQIEYYSLEEWEVLEDNARIDLDDDIYSSAREIVDMVRRNGINPHPYLVKSVERMQFNSYENLLESLNDYVGEDGKYTPIVKSVTLYLNKEEFRGLSIVDTPGLNDPIASRTIRTKEFMEICDVVFFLSQAGSFLDKSDWTLLSSQLPQKGVKRLVLIASKYDSGIRDVLKVKDESEDDIFDEDENSTNNIPKACKLIKHKLMKRAKSKVEEFCEYLTRMESTAELIEVIKQCSKPIMISSMADNMTRKKVDEYSEEEQNIFKALEIFSTDIQSDLKVLGNFGEVNAIFAEVVKEKELILEQKAKSFIPNALEEAKGLLRGYREKALKRIQVLEGNDREQLLEQKKMIELQIGNIKADIAVVFGELHAKLEIEKSIANKELRELSKDYLKQKERSATNTCTKSYTTGFWFWKKTHYYTYEEKYSYYIATDAIENIQKYTIDAINQIEEVFTTAIQYKELKRKLLNVVVHNFDLGSEKYDSSLFRIMVEETVSSIEFPSFHMDLSTSMNEITAKFTGEITSANEKAKLVTALQNAVISIHKKLSNELDLSTRIFKESIDLIWTQIEDSLLKNITDEFESLICQCDNKDQEIIGYKEYVRIIDDSIAKLS